MKRFKDLETDDYLYYLGGLEPCLMSYRIEYTMLPHGQNGIKGFLFTTYCGKEIFVPEYCIKQTSYEGFYTSLNEAVKAFKKRLNAEIIH